MAIEGNNRRYRVFISVADPSADAHCASLIATLRQSDQDIEFVGVGGPKMEAARCQLLQTTVGRSAMIYKSFGQIAHFYALIKRIARYFQESRVDLVVICDSPAFNWHVAKAAKKRGIKTLYYVAPQLWAWAGWRIGKLRKRCDKLCCILPFEQEWFGRRGVDTTFVGNPLFDEIQGDLSTYKKDYANLESKELTLALMPGSRTAEIASLWKPMQQIALRIKQKYPRIKFVAVAADAERQRALQQAQLPGFECRYSVDTVRETAAAADFALVASGSATLQVASAGCPMVAMYQSSRILWCLVGWWLVRPKYFTLVNLLADKELVPEFMPYFTSIEPIVRCVEELLADGDNLARISKELIELAQPLANTKANEEVAKILMKMLR
ncbi:MAG: lipid-A-disaccharide synthase [Phycisphaerales bacterium]|nr:MAG: lipid-A-disaccharide synthase [Phycisphaerales bacterium]